MGICSFGQNKVVRHPVDHKHASVPLCSLSMVSPPCIDGRWFPQGWFAPYYRSGGTGNRKKCSFCRITAVLRCSFCHQLYSFPSACVSSLFPPTLLFTFWSDMYDKFCSEIIAVFDSSFKKKRKLDVDQGLWLRGEKKLWGYFGFLRNTDLPCWQSQVVRLQWHWILNTKFNILRKLQEKINGSIKECNQSHGNENQVLKKADLEWIVSSAFYSRSQGLSPASMAQGIVCGFPSPPVALPPC